MLDNLLDEPLLEQLLEGLAGEGAAHLEPLRDHRRGDEFVAGNLLEQLVVRSLVEQHQVVQLVADFSLGPLLLLGLASGRPFLLFGGPLRVRLLLAILFGRLNIANAGKKKDQVTTSQ